MDIHSLGAGLAAGAAAGTAFTLACLAPVAAPRPATLPRTGMKLYYWPATGIAEVIRIMLADASLAWEDVTFEKSAQNRDLPVYASPGSLGAHASSEEYKTFCAQLKSKPSGNPT